MIGRSGSRIGVALATVLCFCALNAASASADRVFTVDNPLDPNGAACLPDPSPLPCSLRQALSAARTAGDEPVIKLPPGTYTLSLPETAGGISDNANGDLDWADLGPDDLADLRIEGAGSSQTVIQGVPGLNSRIFHFFSATVSVVLSGVTLTGGHPATGAADGLDGGAIYSAMTGPLALEDVRIVDNKTVTIAINEGDGGGIASINNNLSLNNVTLSDNHSSGFGGAIAIYSALGLTPTMQITNSTIRRNDTETYPAADGLGGGGIANFGDGAGGDADPVLTVTNSTIDGNRALGFGGGIDTFGGATTNLASTTVTRNIANSNEISGELGGGLQNGGGTYGVRNSLIFGNAIGIGGNSNCTGPFGSLGGNVVGDLDTCSGFSALLGDLEVADALIGQPSANGGLTQTVPLLAGSPAIDHTSNCPLTDQRGVARPQGAACDSGAFELVPTPPAPAATPTAPPPVVAPPTPAGKKCPKGKKLVRKKGKLKCKKKKRRRK